MRRSLPFYPFVHKQRQRLRAEKPSAVVRHVAARLRASVHEQDRHHVLVKDLSEIAVPVRRGNVTVEPLERRHLPALSALNRLRDDLTGDKRFAGDVDDGYAGFVAVKDGVVIGFYWWIDATMKPHREWQGVATGMKLGPGDVYGTDFYVDERQRACGTANDFLFQIESGLRERGFERLWGTVEVGNRSARWTYSARGYEERWAVVGTRILRRWRYRAVPLEQSPATSA